MFFKVNGFYVDVETDFSTQLLTERKRVNDSAPRDRRLPVFSSRTFPRGDGARGPIARGINTASAERESSFYPVSGHTFSSPSVRREYRHSRPRRETWDRFYLREMTFPRWRFFHETIPHLDKRLYALPLDSQNILLYFETLKICVNIFTAKYNES